MKETSWLTGFSVDADKVQRDSYGRLSMHFKSTETETETYEAICKMAEESEGRISPHQVAKQMLIHMVKSMKAEVNEAKDRREENREIAKKSNERKKKAREYARKHYAKKKAQKEQKKQLAEMDEHNSKVAGDIVRDSPNYAN